MEPHQHVRAELGQGGQARVVRAQAAIALHLPERVAMQRQLREYHQVGALGGGSADAIAYALEVRSHLTEGTVHLSHSDSRHRSRSL
jgi:hypothetical protein